MSSSLEDVTQRYRQEWDIIQHGRKRYRTSAKNMKVYNQECRTML
jgi:hypothetical protein